MKLSANLLNILKNYSTINNSIRIQPGSIISTGTPGWNILSIAEVDEVFETEFAIYDIVTFLSILSLFKEPDFTINNRQVVISEGDIQVNYTSAEPSLVPKAPSSYKGSEVIESFVLTAPNLASVVKAANVFSLPEIVIEGDGQHIFIKTDDVKNSSNNTYRLKIGETTKEFKGVIKIENLRLISDDYKISITNRTAMFESLSKNLKYWVGWESTSKV